nr:hypothetical protein Q903MT_gene930 [Picea sitchensis]
MKAEGHAYPSQMIQDQSRITQSWIQIHSQLLTEMTSLTQSILLPQQQSLHR